MDDARVISNYKLVRQIGIGGMGVVYLGQHTVIDRYVAIKLLRPEYSNNEELVRRFFNEARAAATSRHPGIVEILDVGFDQQQAFITMEYIEGETLSKHVRSRIRLHPFEAVSFCRQVACALAIAHAQNIVHRDLKPSNIMVAIDADSGLPMTKVFDFGIAKLFDENSSHTRTGVVIGTPLYMSPEQCKGAGEVDTRSDLYSLGCILYFMLTGKRVFTGKGDGEIIAQHIFIEPPSPHLLVPVSDDLCAVVLRLLAKEPDDRFQTAEELVAALDLVQGRMKDQSGSIPVAPRAASVLPFAAPALIGGQSPEGFSPGTAPGTGASITGTPAQVMYSSADYIPEVVPPPTLMRRLARKGGWIAVGFALVIVVVIGAVTSQNSGDGADYKPSLAVDPQEADSPDTKLPEELEAAGSELGTPTSDLDKPDNIDDERRDDSPDGDKAGVGPKDDLSQTGDLTEPKSGLESAGDKPTASNTKDISGGDKSNESNQDKSGKRSGTIRGNKNKTGKNRKGPKDSGTSDSDKTKPKTFNPFE